MGALRPRLPKYYETFLFFKISDTDAFKTHLRSFADKITTGAQCKAYFVETDDLPQATPGKPRTDTPPEQRKPFEAVNISFSYKGIEKVRNQLPIKADGIPFSSPAVILTWKLQLVMQRRDDKLDDELHIRGMYKDMVFEGPDDPQLLAPEYRPPKDYRGDNDDWRVDGLFIVTAQTKDKLEEKIKELETGFNVDTASASVAIAFRKEGNLRNADGKAEKAQGGKVSLHGKEQSVLSSLDFSFSFFSLPFSPKGLKYASYLTFDHSLSFGFEDEISQPQIRGLDPEPGKGEQRSIPPG